MESFDTYSPKDKKQNQNHSNVESLSELLKKPTSLIIIILVCVILGMTLQFGQIQSQIASMSNQLGKEQSAEKNLESKYSKLEGNVLGIKIDSIEQQKQTSRLEKKEKDLEEHDKNYRKELNNLENKNGNGGWVDQPVDNQSDKKDDDKDSEDDPGFFSFLDSIFQGIDSVNQDPKEKEANGQKSPFDFPAFPKVFGPTGPVEHPHTSMNDLFQNIAKPGPHPKFANQDDSSPVQELKETNKKVELTEKDKASGIVSDISSHNIQVHHSTPVAPPIVEAPKSDSPVKIKLINPMKKAIEESVKKEKAELAKKKDLTPRKIR